MRILFIAFLFGHAAVHAVMWTLPFTDAVADMPFDPSHSWLLGNGRTIAAILAGIATLAIAVAAIAYGLNAAWWPSAMLAAATTSLLLMAVFLSPWWTVGIALSAALAVYAWHSQPLL